MAQVTFNNFDAQRSNASRRAERGVQWTTTYAYNNAGQLARVTNSFGRVLALAYVNGKLANITTPGIPMPEGGASKLTMRGGLFFGPSFKKDGRFCLRLGPHYSLPLAPSIDLGGMP